jgi:hypothetical protein
MDLADAERAVTGPTLTFADNSEDYGGTTLGHTHAAECNGRGDRHTDRADGP